MKILHVIASMDPGNGGVCQAVRTMIEGLLMNGISSEVVSMDEPSASFLKDDAYINHALGLAKGPWGYNKMLQPWLRANAERFDVVIIHGLWLYPSYATSKVIHELRRNTGDNKKGKRAPGLVVMPHGMLDPYFQKAEGRKLKALRNLVYWKLIESKVVNQADQILFTAIEEARLAATTFKPYFPKKYSVVGLGVEDPVASAPHVFTDNIEDFGRGYLLFLSRIHPKKGVDLLVKAYEEILENRQGLTEQELVIPRLVIAGPGLDSEYGAGILAIVNNSPLLKSHISFPGMLTGSEKWTAFQHSEAFILPSHQENFGIAIVEALACSKPVLITNRINIWQEIDKAEAGFITNPTTKDIKELLINWINLSNEKKQAMGVNARELYLRSFSVSEAAARLSSALGNGVSSKKEFAAA